MVDSLGRDLVMDNRDSLLVQLGLAFPRDRLPGKERKRNRKQEQGIDMMTAGGKKRGKQEKGRD